MEKKTFIIIETILITLFIVFCGLQFEACRHSAKKDLTLKSTSIVKHVSGKEVQLTRDIYFDQIKYEKKPKTGDTLLVRFARDSNPWLDYYYFQVVGPEERLNAYLSGKEFETDNRYCYQKMVVVSIDNTPTLF